MNLNSIWLTRGYFELTVDGCDEPQLVATAEILAENHGVGSSILPLGTIQPRSRHFPTH